MLPLCYGVLTRFNTQRGTAQRELLS